MPVLPLRWMEFSVISPVGFTPVREKTAERIVAAFGEDTFRVIDEEPERLLKEVHDLLANNWQSCMRLVKNSEDYAR